MGDMIEGSCPCGYRTDTFCIGIGMAGPEPNPKFLAPAISKKTGKLVARDYLRHKNDETKSKWFTFYNEPELQGPEPEDMEEGEIDWGYDFALKDLYYYCPNCKNLTMHFILVGLWY